MSRLPQVAPVQKPERIKAKHAKKLMLEMLRKYPIIEAACAKIGISRSTHYEWIKKDAKYSANVEEATRTSLATVTDIAESNIIEGVKKGEYKHTAFWLTHRHPIYKQKPHEAQEPVEHSFLNLAAEAGKRLGKTESRKILSPKAMKSLKRYRKDL